MITDTYYGGLGGCFEPHDIVIVFTLIGQLHGLFVCLYCTKLQRNCTETTFILNIMGFVFYLSMVKFSFASSINVQDELLFFYHHSFWLYKFTNMVDLFIVYPLKGIARTYITMRSVSLPAILFFKVFLFLLYCFQGSHQAPCSPKTNNLGIAPI